MSTELRWRSLPKKLNNRINSIFIPFVTDRNKLKDILGDIQILDFSAEKNAKVNISLPKFLSCLFDKELGIHSVDMEGIEPLLQIISESLGKNTSMEKLLISIGMGGSEVMPSIRLPAYILPIIQGMERVKSLSKEGIIIPKLPKVRIFKANHMACYVNGFDLERVLQVSDVTLKFLEEFVKHFYPDLVDNFIFESDIDWYSQIDGLSLMSEFKSNANTLKTLNSVSEEVNKVMQMGYKHGGDKGAESALLYTAAHPYYNQTLVKNDLRVNVIPSHYKLLQPEFILDYGGPPQSVFNDLSIVLRNALPSSDYYKPELMHIIQRTGKVPVYYTARNGDIAIGDDISQTKLTNIDRITKYDYKLIFNAVTQHDYLSFVSNFIKNNKYFFSK